MYNEALKRAVPKRSLPFLWLIASLRNAPNGAPRGQAPCFVITPPTLFPLWLIAGLRIGRHAPHPTRSPHLLRSQRKRKYRLPSRYLVCQLEVSKPSSQGARMNPSARVPRTSSLHWHSFFVADRRSADRPTRPHPTRPHPVVPMTGPCTGLPIFYFPTPTSHYAPNFVPLVAYSLFLSLRVVVVRHGLNGSQAFPCPFSLFFPCCLFQSSVAKDTRNSRPCTGLPSRPSTALLAWLGSSYFANAYALPSFGM